MDPKLENRIVNEATDEISEHKAWFNFWIETRETSDGKAIEAAFLTAVGKEALTLLKMLVYPRT